MPPNDCNLFESTTCKRFFPILRTIVLVEKSLLSLDLNDVFAIIFQFIINMCFT